MTTSLVNFKRLAVLYDPWLVNLEIQGENWMVEKDQRNIFLVVEMCI